MIEVVDAVSDELTEALRHLVPQLSRSAPAVTRERVEAVVASDANRVLIARDAAGRIVGTLTLVVVQIPTGTHAWIEDVIVDERARGQGVGAALTQEGLRIARDEGARAVDLTSRPSREAANALYLRAGFTRRDTNVYRYEL